MADENNANTSGVWRIRCPPYTRWYATRDDPSLPIDASTENLSGGKAIKELDNAKGMRLVLRFEQAHQNRRGLTTAAQQRMVDFAKGSVTLDLNHFRRTGTSSWLFAVSFKCCCRGGANLRR